MICIAEGTDGTFGVGTTSFSAPVASIINDHFSPHLTGLNVMSTERAYDMMLRLSAHYGSSGMTAYAISAVDLALWDLKGKTLKTPVYELLGGPQKDRIPCYATGFHTKWYHELGFSAFKLPLIYGIEDGIAGLRQTEQMISEARGYIGPDKDLMLDCWMALDVETTVRLGELLRPHGLRWMEDYLLPEHMEGFQEVRRRLPGIRLATGEHWYHSEPFQYAASRHLLDVFQPDVKWCGGISASQRICHIAEAAGISVIPHGGMGEPYGQHLSLAMPSIPWGEWYAGGIQAGDPIPESGGMPGTPVPKDGFLTPSDAPDFGIDVDRAWLERLVG